MRRRISTYPSGKISGIRYSASNEQWSFVFVQEKGGLGSLLGHSDFRAEPLIFCLRLVDQPMVNRVQRQFQPVGNAQFIEDVVQVIFHRLLGDEQLLSDFLIAEPLRN